MPNETTIADIWIDLIAEEAEDSKEATMAIIVEAIRASSFTFNKQHMGEKYPLLVLFFQDKSILDIFEDESGEISIRTKDYAEAGEEFDRLIYLCQQLTHRRAK